MQSDNLPTTATQGCFNIVTRSPQGCHNNVIAMTTLPQSSYNVVTRFLHFTSLSQPCNKVVTIMNFHVGK